MQTDFVGVEIKTDSRICIRLGSLQMVSAYIRNGIARPYPFIQQTKKGEIMRDGKSLEYFECEIKEGENRKIAVMG